MKALLWKDFRVNLPIMLAAVFIWAAAHAVAATSLLIYAEQDQRWGEAMFHVTAASLIFSQLLIGALGANAMATERGDRSAEFMFYLPATRREILASKFFVALAVALAIWLWHVFVMEIICPALSAGAMPSRTPSIFAIVSSGISLFGTAWFASSFMKSTAYALLVGLVPFAAVGALFTNNVVARGWPPEGTREGWYVGIHLTMGILAFAAGTWYYVRRVEP
jgi:ABC-type transport system involved in multi-copper enzyme maturation permease subunit